MDLGVFYLYCPRQEGSLMGVGGRIRVFSSVLTMSLNFFKPLLGRVDGLWIVIAIVVVEGDSTTLKHREHNHDPSLLE